MAVSPEFLSKNSEAALASHGLWPKLNMTKAQICGPVTHLGRNEPHGSRNLMLMPPHQPWSINLDWPGGCQARDCCQAMFPPDRLAPVDTGREGVPGPGIFKESSCGLSNSDINFQHYIMKIKVIASIVRRFLWVPLLLPYFIGIPSHVVSFLCLCKL